MLETGMVTPHPQLVARLCGEDLEALHERLHPGFSSVQFLTAVQSGKIDLEKLGISEEQAVVAYKELLHYLAYEGMEYPLDPTKEAFHWGPGFRGVGEIIHRQFQPPFPQE